MADIAAKDVKALRDATGAGMMDAKKALIECDGDFEAAAQMLREKGSSQGGHPLGPRQRRGGRWPRG